MRKKLAVIIFLSLVIFWQSGISQNAVQARREIRIPDISGYLTLKCDLHMHTVFSDGGVWPTVRVREAWLEGLDAIAITDHLEWLPHKEYVTPDLNLPYQLAKAAAEDCGLILIPGAEITRGMPPGHLNAIFLADANALKTETWREAVAAALAQDAFLFWNHPGWKGQQKDGVARWYDEHTELLEKGWLKGIEVVNNQEYYPAAQQWCLDQNLTMLGNSDVHDPTNLVWDFANGEHRPLTLVFAQERSPAGIRAALLEHRTAVYYQDTLIGRAEFLNPIFFESIEIRTPELSIGQNQQGYLQIRNCSDVNFDLIRDGELTAIRFPDRVTLFAHKTALLPIKMKTDIRLGESRLQLPYQVTNLWVTPRKGLRVKLPVTVEYLDRE